MYIYYRIEIILSKYINFTVNKSFLVQAPSTVFDFGGGYSNGWQPQQLNKILNMQKNREKWTFKKKKFFLVFIVDLIQKHQYIKMKLQKYHLVCNI